MQEPRLRLPRGVLAGAILALCMIVPLMAAIALDAGFGRHRQALEAAACDRTKVAASAGATTEFFDGKVAVHVYLLHPQENASVLDSAGVRAHPDRGDTLGEQPPAVRGDLHVQLENRSAEPIAVELAEVTSNIGDVSAGPQRLKLAPGQTMDTGTVVTRHVASAIQIPVKITMRLSAREETRALVLPTGLSVAAARTP